MHPKLEEALSVLSYAPVALFAQSFRVQESLIRAVAAPDSFAPCLTGSIKDIEWLWKVNAYSLFGKPSDGFRSLAVSIRHGNTFEVANTALLRAIGVHARRLSNRIDFATKLMEVDTRETVLNLYIILPGEQHLLNPSDHPRVTRPKAVVATALFLELSGLTALFYVSYERDIVAGCILAACMATLVLILMLVKTSVRPNMGNKRAIKADHLDGVARGAALDVHVLADSWNGSELDVYCGYSSHLHALTNIAVRLENEGVLRWCSRLILAALIAQASTLASNLGKRTETVFASLIWLAMYVAVYFVHQVLDHLLRDPIRQRYLGNINEVGHLAFTNRRNALTFLSRLPVSHGPNVGEWAWLDVFMPNNARRRDWQAQVDSVWPFANDSPTPPPSEETEQIPFRTRMNVEEASAALHSEVVASQLEKFKSEVRWT